MTKFYVTLTAGETPFKVIAGTAHDDFLRIFSNQTDGILDGLIAQRMVRVNFVNGRFDLDLLRSNPSADAWFRAVIFEVEVSGHVPPHILTKLLLRHKVDATEPLLERQPK